MLLSRLLYLCTQPPAAPVRRLTLYYLGLGAITWAALLAFPRLIEYVVADTFGAFGGSGFALERAGVQAADVPDRLAVTLTLVVSMVGALALMMPVSWVYMGTRRRVGFDQSVVQTMVILPIAVAGIVVMVQNSLALAFSLAGIVAGVRFRNTLKDTADALYIFAAIGVGLACGIGALSIAAVISVFFNYVILALWRCDYGTCPVAGPLPEYSSGLLLSAVRADSEAKPKKKKKKGKGKHHDESPSVGQTASHARP